MSSRKDRVTITLDSHVVEAGNKAVASGRADSLSGWVNLALIERIEKERRLAAMAEAVAAYEMRFGVISAEEIAEQEHADREAALVVRGSRKQQMQRRGLRKAARGLVTASAIRTS